MLDREDYPSLNFDLTMLGDANSSEKPSVILIDDWLPKLYPDKDGLLLILETITCRVIIPIQVEDREKASELIANFFIALGKLVPED